jgi:hypothetical protein
LRGKVVRNGTLSRNRRLNEWAHGLSPRRKEGEANVRDLIEIRLKEKTEIYDYESCSTEEEEKEGTCGTRTRPYAKEKGAGDP